MSHHVHKASLLFCVFFYTPLSHSCLFPFSVQHTLRLNPPQFNMLKNQHLLLDVELPPLAKWLNPSLLFHYRVFFVRAKLLQ